MYTKKTHEIKTKWNQGFYIDKLLEDNEKIIKTEFIKRVNLGEYFSLYNKVSGFTEYGIWLEKPEKHIFHWANYKIKTSNNRTITSEIIPSSVKYGIINFYEIKPFLFFFHKKEPIGSTYFDVEIKEVPINNKSDKENTKETKEDYNEFLKN